MLLGEDPAAVTAEQHLHPWRRLFDIGPRLEP